MRQLFAQDKFLILDGAMGTTLQAAGLEAGARPELVAIENPALLTGVHREYVAVGANIICTNTFGANSKKLAGSGYTAAQVIAAAVQAAKAACTGTNTLVALDVGPLGELLEPTGTLTFEAAYALFAEVAQLGYKAGANCVLIETMTDLYEVRAALLAVKENTPLPALVSMTFEQNGRTFAGVSIEAMAATLGPLGADALGINCSLGPAEIMPMAKTLCESTPLPVFVKPNAGLPNPQTGAFSIGPREFCGQLAPALSMGVSMVGGCCGTTPETIRAVAAMFGGKKPAKRRYIPQSIVCSGTRVVRVTGVHPIGERINPTGKKRLQEALRTGDMGYIQTQAVLQQQDGAEILDVNVGAPGVDEVAVLPRVVRAVQAVTDLPLQLDSANPAALEAALRVYNGKPIVNSTSGEEEKLQSVLPLCKKYGAAVVGLTLDENGIPETAEGRFAIAQKIQQAALAARLPQEDIYIDCLVLTASAIEGAGAETLRAVAMVHKKLGLKTVLGVSNISFGLPCRPQLNQTFLTLAMANGLSLPILNPAAEGMMGAIFSYNLLMGRDAGSQEYVARFGGQQPAQQLAAKTAMPLHDAIVKGLKAEAGAAAKTLLAGGEEGLAIVNKHLMPALDEVGNGFEKGTLFLPQLLAAADAAGAAFEEIKASYGSGQTVGPPVVLATVKGDIHDIGKNIVKVLMENYGFTVIDLGRDVPVERVVEAARTSGAKLVGLSALMTTTLPAMEATIQALHAANLPCKVVVGGAVLTESYARQIGADYYAKDAKRSVDIARQLHTAEG